MWEFRSSDALTWIPNGRAYYTDARKTTNLWNSHKSFQKSVAPYMDLKWQDSYHRDTRTKDPQFTEAPVWFLQVSAENPPCINPKPPQTSSNNFRPGRPIRWGTAAASRMTNDKKQRQTSLKESHRNHVWAVCKKF